MDLSQFISFMMEWSPKVIPLIISLKNTFVPPKRLTVSEASETMMREITSKKERKEGEQQEDSENTIDRIYAMSDLMRSYSISGFLELGFWIWKGIFIYLMFSKVYEFLVRSARKKPE